MAGPVCLGVLLVMTASLSVTVTTAIATPSLISHNDTTIVKLPDEMASVTLFIVGIPYNISYSNPSSEVYRSLYDQFHLVFNATGGKLLEMALGNGGGCISMYLMWQGGYIGYQTLVIKKFTEASMTVGVGLPIVWLSLSDCNAPAPEEGYTYMEFTLFVGGFPWSDQLNNISSYDYTMVKEAITMKFQNMGGHLQTMQLWRNDGCVEVFIQWMAKDDEMSMALYEDIVKTGVMIKGTTYKVDTKRCQNDKADNFMEFTVYISEIQWDDDFRNQASLSYMMVKQVIMSYMTNLTGELQNLEMRPNYNCLQIFIQWKSFEDESKILNIISNLTKTGIMVDSMRHKFSDKPCYYKEEVSPPKEGYTYMEFTLFVAEFTWSDELNNTSSYDYSQVKDVIIKKFLNMGGHLQNMQLWRNNECLEIFIQWMAKDDEMSLDLLENIVKTGVTIQGTTYKVDTKRCRNETADNFMEATVYISGIPWDNDFKNPASPNSMMVKEIIMSQLTSLTGYLQNLEIRPNYNCLQIFIQWKSFKDESMILSNIISNLTKTGIRVENMRYNIRTKPCEEEEEVSLCDLTTEPCGANGQCTGNYMASEICSCNRGFGGLFCEINKPDNLTDCQKMRRLNMFVHDQVNGHSPQLTSMTASMQEIMTYIGEKVYTLPYCLPGSGEFYSMCDIEVQTASKVDCYCVNRRGEPNYWDFVAEDDCRVYIAKTVTRVMFLHNLKWSENLRNHNSSDYLRIKSQLDKHFSQGKGRLGMLQLNQWGNGDCVEMIINYSTTESPQVGERLINSLSGQTLLINATKIRISLLPCNDKIDINACPEIRNDSFGICQFECDAQIPCANGLTCCKNECGGGLCLELGFLQKMNANITLDLQFESSFETIPREGYSTMKQNMMVSINSLMASNEVKGISRIEFLGFARSNESSVPSAHADRRRRQAIQYNTIIMLQFFFIEEISVDKFMAIKRNLYDDGLKLGAIIYNVLDVAFGKEGQCGNTRCAFDSFCVERIGNKHQCVCPSGHVGSGCQIKNSCENPDGSSKCQNGALCNFDTYHDTLQCVCEPGYHGRFCETKICDLFADDVCIDGTCIADMDDMRLCQCPPLKFGIFCQYEMVVDAFETTCQRHEDFTNFIMSVVKGVSTYNPLRANVSSLFPIFNATRGSMMVPTCRFDNPASRGEYHYYCGYNTTTGIKSTTQDCMCTTGDGTPNYWTYENGTCLVHTEIMPCDRMPCLNNGRCYNSGYNYICKCTSGFRGERCQDNFTVDINACPKVRNDSFGTCQSECDAQRPCANGLTCCKNECGGALCLELGFLQKMNVNITIELQFESHYENSMSVEYIAMKELVMFSIQSLMYSNEVKGMSRVELLGFSNASLESMARANRKRRQAVQNNMVIMLQFFFLEEISVDKFMAIKQNLNDDGFKLGAIIYNVLDVALGKEGQCGNTHCASDSFCVERIGNRHQCAHPSGNQTKSICGLFVDDVCNTGTCIGDMEDMRLCRCPPLKFGIFCQLTMVVDDVETRCKRHEDFTNFIMSVIKGVSTYNPLRTNVASLFPIFNATRGSMMVPTCRFDNPARRGEYHYYCGYNTTTGIKSTTQDCMCTTGDGTPNYWTYENGTCLVHNERMPCDRMPCLNNGQCTSSGNTSVCTCLPGFGGPRCQNVFADGECPENRRPLMQSFGLWTCSAGRPCPLGFECNGDPKNGTCCFKMDFLCDLITCGNNSIRCKGDLNSGEICQCKPRTSGLFCDADFDGVHLTKCQKRQRFNQWIETILETGLTPSGSNLNDFRKIFLHTGSRYIPIEICDEYGEFKKKSIAVSIMNVNDKKEVCLDEDGNIDSSCQGEVCDIFDRKSIVMCMNGGRCQGNLTMGICDCRGTNHHGIRCELHGARNDATKPFCMRQREMVQFLLGLFNGSTEIIPNVDLSNITNELKGLIGSDLLFEPYCDTYGRFAKKGCAHSLSRPSNKVCFCATENGEQVGDETNLLEPPQVCHLDPDVDDDCPWAWGPNCKKPEWWCSHELSCIPDEEKCYFSVECDDEECSKTAHAHCVPVEMELDCEMRPCEDDKYKMCQPCGAKDKCYHVDKAKRARVGAGNFNKPRNAGSKEDDEDDNDSAEKQLRLWGTPSKERYVCDCPIGRSGPNCEIHDEICAMTPTELCQHGCVGDLESGKLCRCPKGLAGLMCDKSARTPCEIRKAFYADVLGIMRDRITIADYSSSELKLLVKAMMSTIGAYSIPEVQCTANGFYEKVICDVNVNDLDEKTCFCVNHTGGYIASNIKPYIGYDTCTGPGDFSGLINSCNVQNMPICRNGGSCVFDLYEGKICSCPDGYYGQLCETEEPQDESNSLCEFMRDSFNYSQTMMKNWHDGRNMSSALITVSNIMASFISINSNRTTNGYPSQQVALKVECNEDGDFKEYACDHDLISGERIACYCLTFNGPFIGSEAPNPESLKCEDLQGKDCHELDECPNLECEHGHRHNLVYCPICECRHPCEGHACGMGERCVVKHNMDCDESEKGAKCNWPVCVPKHKPGVCPGYKLERFNNAMRDHSNNRSDTAAGGDMPPPGYAKDDQCQVKCHDDADCQGSMKCCGFCGNMCVEPEESENCLDQKEIMREHLEFIKEIRNQSREDSIPLSLLKTITYTDKTHHIWVPDCRDTKYSPVQCMYNVSSLLMGTKVPTECFCVDRLGHRIKESVGQLGNDSSCSVKPLLCPVLQPPTYHSDIDECMEDMDCAKSHKCCSDGFRDVCAQPVAKAEKDSVMDEIVESICDTQQNMCGYGPCKFSEWETYGQLCNCSNEAMGPFCERRVSGDMQKPRTACERKSLTTYLFLMSLKQQMSEYINQSNATKVDLVTKSFLKSLAWMTKNELKNKETTVYQCDEEGRYQPMQCDYTMDSEKGQSCFCVDDKGKELLGTRKPYGQPLPFCRNEGKCPTGHPLHNDDGTTLSCGKNDRCPYGYSCIRGMYGKLYCCPNEKESEDFCKHPVDVGFQCTAEYRTGYYYDTASEMCVETTFKGCGGNRNSFKNKADCIMRCKDKIHFGVCPSKPFKVAKFVDCDQNKCETDGDCHSDRLKCCQSTCGKRCIPTIDDSPPKGQCPVGPSKTCQYDSQCANGHYCHQNGGINGSICCLDVRDIDYCNIKPFTMEKDMQDNDDNDSSDADKRADDNDSDEDDDDDEMSMKPIHGMHCKTPMHRFYYNNQSKRCEMFNGCAEDFNTFDTLEDCCQTCSTGSRCKIGECPRLSNEMIVSCKDECSSDLSCPGKKICCATGCKSKCVNPYEEETSTCLSQLKDVKKAMSAMPNRTCNTVHVPRCDKNGEYSKQQCQTSLGICWCVTPLGNYIDLSITRGVANCDTVSDTDIDMADSSQLAVKDVDYKVCPTNIQVHCCSENLCVRRCHAHPEAMCRINPCGGCSAEFYDADNNIVDCNEDLTACQLELKDSLKILNARDINAKIKKGEQEDEEREERRNNIKENNDWGSVLRNDIPLKCQQTPETGPCEGFARRWFYNPLTRTCSMFIWGMCAGNGNRFSTPKECYDTCDSGSNPCNTVDCDNDNPECTLLYDDDCYMNEKSCVFQPTCTMAESAPNVVSGVFVPRCLSSGAYNYKQCHDHLCWCVNDQGKNASGLSSTYLECDTYGPIPPYSAVADCPANSDSAKPRPECLKECNAKVCPGHPTAKCTVDLCSNTCLTSFKDEQDETVSCGENKCQDFSYDNENNDQCKAEVLCDGGQVKNCPSTVCDDAKEELCPRNPCAICMVDPCTCQPYFIDAITSKRVNPNSRACTMLVKGSCTVLTCQLKLESIPEENFPQCTASGSFRNKQCHGDNCYCVESSGDFIRNVSASGRCQEINEIKKVELALSFDGDFKELQKSGALRKVKGVVRQKLLDEGVPPEIILSISEPYEGSVKVDVVLAEGDVPSEETNFEIISNSIVQKIQDDDFNIEVDGEVLNVQKDRTVIANTPESLLGDDDDDDDDDDDLTTTEIIIIAACAGGVAFLLLGAIITCCCCKDRKEPEPVDDTYDHIRAPKDVEKNIYDDPTMYTNKSYQSENPYVDINDDQHYMKVRL